MVVAEIVSAELAAVVRAEQRRRWACAPAWARSLVSAAASDRRSASARVAAAAELRRRLDATPRVFLKRAACAVRRALHVVGGRGRRQRRG